MVAGQAWSLSDAGRRYNKEMLAKKRAGSFAFITPLPQKITYREVGTEMIKIAVSTFLTLEKSEFLLYYKPVRNK